LDRVLAGLPRQEDENVLVGFDTADDAGVYRLTPECALVETVDFFTPIVDDPRTFGAIAAANALSDVYAMGGEPLTALTIAAYPARGELDDLAEILRGGAEKMREAGCVILGGHTVADEEIKFGYAVIGRVHPAQVWTNAGARPGDVLVLTKRIGTGVISTALKQGRAREDDVRASIDSMLTLNRRAAEAARDLAPHGATDVTGFGLLGHAREMALASRVTLELETAAIRFLPGAAGYARAGAIPGGLHNNREFVSPCVDRRGDVPEEIEALLYDPQTSGGLLLSLSAAAAATFLARLESACRVGRVVPAQGKPLVLL
jgi:selenide,water dikinase